MPKKSRAAAPPSPEARENLFAELRQTTEPVTAKDLAKRLAEPHQLRPADVAQTLADAAAAGEIYSYSGKTAKSPPRYWDRDATAIARSAIRSRMESAEWPLTAREIASTLSAPLKFTEKDIEPLLRELVASGTLHEIPRKTAKGQPRYWQHGVIELGRRAVLSAVSKGPLSKPALKRAAKGFEAHFEELLKALLDARSLWRHPPLGKAKTESYGLQPPSPGDYLKDLSEQFAKTVNILRAAHVPDDDLRRAIVQLAEAAGVSLGVSRMPGNSSQPVDGVDLLALMKQIKPGVEMGAMVTARELRRAVSLDKVSFDRLVLHLAREGRLMLHRHDHAAHLIAEERDELITDGKGNHFIGVALRRSDELQRTSEAQ